MNEKNFIARNHCLKETPEVKVGLISKIRGYLYEKYGVWDVIDIFPCRLRMYYWEIIKPIFKPCNQRIRKSIPRTWKDISHLMIDVNFEFIKALKKVLETDDVI